MIRFVNEMINILDFSVTPRIISITPWYISCIIFFFFLMLRPPPGSPLFPYPALFRSNLGEVDYLPEGARCVLPAGFSPLGELLREVVPKLGGAYAHVDGRYDDASWVGNRWAEILPLTPAERLELLELDDPLARLGQVAAWSTRAEQPAK